MDEEARSTAVAIAALVSTLRTLRGDKGCPWDREQSLDDIITNLIDEAYELLHAERTGDLDSLREELGDVLYLALFVQELLLEKGGAPLAGIVEGVHEKIRSRHPHVFGGSRAETVSESVAEWERIKSSEKGRRRESGLLGEIPPALPPLRKAVLVQKRAAGVGFDWPDETGIIEKLGEEARELSDAIHAEDRQRIKEEIGDLVFTVANLARRCDIDPENALEKATHKFVRRIAWMERRAKESGADLESMKLDEMEALWQESKNSV